MCILSVGTSVLFINNTLHTNYMWQYILGQVAEAQTAAAVGTAASTTITNVFSALGTFLGNNAELLITVAVFVGLVSYALSRFGMRTR